MSAKPKRKFKTFKLPRPDKNKKKKIVFTFTFRYSMKASPWEPAPNEFRDIIEEK